jgi:hypothetical protein
VDIPIPASAIEVDIRRGRLGRLGRLGEHDAFAAQVLGRRVQEPTGYGSRALPSAEDRILLLALSRVFGRPRVRLSDVWVVAHTFATDGVDVDRLLAHARAAGLLHGLACFLDYVDQVGRRLLGDPLFGASLRARLPGGPWGRVAWRDGGFRGPTTRVAPYLYAQLLSTRVLERIRA